MVKKHDAVDAEIVDVEAEVEASEVEFVDDAELSEEDQDLQDSEDPETDLPNDGSIPLYADTEGTMRAKVDEMMQTINPFDYSTAMEFGLEPAQRLQEVAESVIQSQDSYEEILEAVQESFGKITEVDLSGVVGRTMAAATKAGKDITSKAAKFAWRNPFTTAGAVLAAPLTAGASLLALPGKHLANKVTGKGGEGKKSAEEKQNNKDYKEAVAEIKECELKTKEIIASLKQAQKIIPGAIEDLQVLGETRAEIYDETALYICAGTEALRRIQEEIAPQVQAETNANPSGENQMKVDNLRVTAETLENTLMDMDVQRTNSKTTFITLQRSVDMFVAINRKIQYHLTRSVPSWINALAEARIQLTAFSVAAATTTADNHDSNIQEQTILLHGKTSKVARKSLECGTNDPTKAIENAERLQKIIEDETLALEGRRSDLNANRLALQAASSKLDGAVSKNRAAALKRSGMALEGGDPARKKLAAAKAVAKAEEKPAQTKSAEAAPKADFKDAAQGAPKAEPKAAPKRTRKKPASFDWNSGPK